MILQRETRRLTQILKRALGIGMASALVFSGFVYADEIISEDGSSYEYSKIDEMTGQPIDDKGNTDTSENDDITTVRVTTDCMFDKNTGLYMFSVSGIGENIISANIGCGAVTQQPVTIEISGNVTAKLYCDGLEIENNGQIKEAGYYVLKVFGANGKTYSPLVFTIVGKYTNEEVLSASGIYKIEYLVVDDSSINIESNSISLSEEGKYTFSVYNTFLRNSEKIEMTVMHTAPTLKLEAVDEKGLARGPVDISDADSDWDLTVYYEGETIKHSGVLTDSGKYSVIVTDKAGNSNTYTFTILLYINNIGLIFICIVVGLVTILILYIIIARKKMKVR